MDGKIGVFQGTRNNLNDRDDDKVTVRAYNKNSPPGNPNGKIECEQKKAPKNATERKLFFG